jgi:AbrB family transcriptional regulator (stage V sporulation protein T)
LKKSIKKKIWKKQKKTEKNRRKINAMKATGIVRRIDDLGRVVVPKEIRRTLRIREGDPLEIFTDKEGEIILKKYSPIGELSAFAKQYAESLSQMLGCLAGICDMDQVVAAAGNGKKELQDEDITRELGEFLKERKTQNAKAGEKRYVPVVSKTEPYSQEVISPILCAGDVIGAVLLLNMDQKDLFEEREICLAEYTAKVLGKQMEQ